jgi:outer membrane translocation and assembly module TamA
MRHRLAAAGVAVVLAAAAASAQEGWEALRGVAVCDVRIEAAEVFDLDRPGESHFLFRWANALHVRTRAHVIRRELLLDVGAPFVPELAAESERNLRALDIFQDVALLAERTADGVVLIVRTSDRWTTEVRTELRSQGGISQVGFGLSDANLLGRAFELGGGVTSSTDVDAASARWRDPRLLGSRWAAGLSLRRDDLERSLAVGLEHPFYSETVRWSAAAAFSRTRGDRRRFESGVEAERLAVTERIGDGFAALHVRGARLHRVAALYSQRHHNGDPSGDAALLAVAWSSLARRFHAARDVDLLGSVEDVATGTTLQLGAGADLRALGAARDRSFVRADAGWARALGARALFGVHVRQYAFVRRGELENARAAVESFGYWQTPGVQTLAWRIGAAALVDEPPDLRFNLGGDDRLRGYAARHLAGERCLYASLEERLFSERRLFFLRWGAVVFVDAAAAWDRGEALARDKARLGTGLGLRVASNRAGSSLVGLDVAVGAGSVQVSVASGSFFRVARGLSYLDPRPFR